MTIKNYRLSSDFLYTYTTKLENIKLMLKHGIRHSLNREKLPYKNSEQHNFIVCFCDILPEQADYHKSIYGSYSIAFTKEWGIKNGISPLRYIHKNSLGATADYVQIKNDNRTARATLQDGNQVDYFQSLVFFRKAREKGLFKKDSISEEIENNELKDYMGKFDTEYDNIKNQVGDENLKVIFNKLILPIIHSLELVIDELEKRDAFVRIYQGEFRGIPNKILYDEREWRSVKFITEAEEKANPGLNERCRKDGFLPENYNLKFVADDIHAILVETEFEKDEIKKYIEDELPSLKGIETKVTTFSEYLAL